MLPAETEGLKSALGKRMQDRQQEALPRFPRVRGNRDIDITCFS